MKDLSLVEHLIPKGAAGAGSIGERALSRLRDIGLPTSQQDAWHYTPLKKLFAQTWQRSEQEVNVGWSVGTGLLSGARLYKENLTLTSLETSAGRLPQSALALLNFAESNERWVLEITPGAELERHLILSCVAPEGYSAPHLSIVMGANSKASVELQLIDKGPAASRSGQEVGKKINSVVSVKLAAGSTLELYQSPKLLPTTALIETSLIEVAKDAHLVRHQVNDSGALVRNEVDARLVGAGANLQLFGVYALQDDHFVENQIRVAHEHGDTQSEQHYKGVLADKSRAAFCGKVIIEKGAQRSNAKQLNRNLLVSKTAEVDTKPELDIYADDVKASHGATVGQMDAEQVFYLQSRAISKSRAQNLVLQAFLGEVFENMTDANVRERLWGQLTLPADKAAE